MNDKQIRIYPARREVDTERLAMALLDLVAKLNQEDKARLLAEDDRSRKTSSHSNRRKGSAA
jgi:hypothetical protein